MGIGEGGKEIGKDCIEIFLVVRRRMRLEGVVGKGVGIEFFADCTGYCVELREGGCCGGD